ncbi:MAG: cytochrome-c peroxidase [Campylobacterales bacterium]|nr:cytochrome-c peroxidase [Campylobacterales bacterium]
MKLLNSLVAVSCITVSVFAADALIKQAKDAGLEPIPTKQKDLMKIIDSDSNKITPAKVELGKKLYFDPRLSKSNLISCNTCHNLALAGADLVPAAIGHKWTANPSHLNSPTVYNAVFAKSQFWDGRDPHLEAQAQGPIQAMPEMAASKELIEQRINSIPEYVNEFKKIYGKESKIDLKLVADTIAVFEKTLTTPSRFDDYLNGNEKALTKDEKEGLKVFIDKGCATCHNGIALGGTMQPFEVAGKYKHAELGGFKGNKDGHIKVPTLRNILETAPYYHNGAIWDIKEAIAEMGKIQLGVELNEKEVNAIATFFNSLTGTKPKIEYPILPASTAATPKPEAN